MWIYDVTLLCKMVEVTILDRITSLSCHIDHRLFTYLLTYLFTSRMIMTEDGDPGLVDQRTTIGAEWQPKLEQTVQQYCLVRISLDT